MFSKQPNLKSKPRFNFIGPSKKKKPKIKNKKSNIWEETASTSRRDMEMEAEKKSHTCKAEPQEEEGLSFLNKEPENSRPPAGAQLTIFYNGSVSVYDAVTPEKAQAIMLIAAAASAVSVNNAPLAVGHNAAGAVVNGDAGAGVAGLTRCLSRQSSTAAAAAAGSPPPHQQVVVPSGGSSLCKMQADLPIARRQSLQQFLEKRRNRLVNKAPYAVAKKSDEGMDVGSENPQPQHS